MPGSCSELAALQLPATSPAFDLSALTFCRRWAGAEACFRIDWCSQKPPVPHTSAQLPLYPASQPEHLHTVT